MAGNYEQLEIWKKAINFTILVYRRTKNFPREEQFGLTSQLQRAVTSVPANIAEGSGRNSKKEFERFINISLGSLNEVETFLFISKELKYITKEDFDLLKEKADELGRLIGGFRNYLKK